MARPASKARWTKIIPKSAERSTYVLVLTFLIDHLELFGFKQSYYQLVGKEIPPASFKTPYLYQYVRYPLMVGFIIALCVTPLMTVGRLLFAAVTTVYILIAIQIEERDLISFFSDEYREYCKRTPMLIPRLSR